ncbi:hypothetical protein [Metallibacterium scheffleri]|uniref:hypothetical protein n=1 Tax=Metallibacterium scheffleri TaxID=993689 RepID=UPI0026EBC1BE|nr:hypothetical protein [Metallibacterium scheffleri]MBW8074698.1 hypothetical protein [Metallibacterium scheffleri]
MSDSTLDSMRGRFITGAGQILYFGVEMLSTWHSPDGRVLSGSALLSFDFSKGMPQVTFVPTVSIVQGSGSGVLVDTTGRSIDASGLANVSGIAQGIQIVGDHNSAGNSTELHVTTTLPASSDADITGNAALAVGDANASVALQPDSIAVTLGMDGQGSLRQIIRGDASGGGSVLQTVSLLGDGHDVGNQLRITLVQPSTGAALQLQQNVALSLGLLQGLRSGR